MYSCFKSNFIIFLFSILNLLTFSFCIFVCFDLLLAEDGLVDILLMGQQTSKESHEDILENALADTSAGKDIAEKNIERGGKAIYAKAYDDKYFLEKCFPQYFPYGLGGPSLMKRGSSAINIKAFARMVLTGDIKRCKLFHNDFKFISLCYYVVMRHKIRGIKFLILLAGMGVLIVFYFLIRRCLCKPS